MQENCDTHMLLLLLTFGITVLVIFANLIFHLYAIDVCDML